MGLLDVVLGKLGGAAGGGPQSQQSENPLGALVKGLAGGGAGQGAGVLAAVMSMIQGHGGLGAVLDMFRQKGLAKEADSWVGTGANAAVGSDQVEQVFGGLALSGLAS